MEKQSYSEYLKSEKWKAIAKKRLEIDDFKCVCCGSRGTVCNPLEIHHLAYTHIYQEESRVYEDLVTLCRVCHKGTHNMMNRVTNEDGRRGWKDNRHIPEVHTFNVTGTETERLERYKQENGGK